MYRVLTCLTGQHDYRLVALAALVCLVASITAFWLYPAALNRQGARRWWLVALAGGCTAAGIWTTHFVAMLAYDAGLPVTYDLQLTVGSLLIAILATTAGFALMTTDRMTNIALGGAVIGLGISAMHFTGMESVIAGGRVTWDSSLVAVSIVGGMVLASAACMVHARLPGRWSSLGAPLLLTLAICAMHFTAMGAATFVPDPTITASVVQVDTFTLAIMVTGLCVIITVVGVFATITDRFNIARGTLAFGGIVLATLTATIAISGYMVEQMRIGGPSYGRIIESKDLIADILPPPVYIIEAYLEARLAADQPERVADHKQRLLDLQRDYLARHAYWSATNKIPSKIKTLLIEDSHAQVNYFWAEIRTGFVPALELGDKVGIAISFDRLTANYLAHRQILDEVIGRSIAFSAEEERATGVRGHLLKWLVVGAVLALVLVVAGAILALRGYVVDPLLKTTDYLSRLASGRYDEKAPFTARSDEIGTMANAIETLRHSSQERQRLEAEALAEARRRELARAVREKEKAREAMRLNMANENITSLNEELNETIEQLKKVQDEIVRKGKLAQLGQLTATVAHEIRNPLGAIKTAIFLIDRKTQGKGLALEAAMKRVHNGVERCDTIITELLDFTRTKALALNSLSLDDWVKSVIDDERRNLPSEVEIVCDLGVGPAAIQFDDSRMRRVLINLLSNASEAMVGKTGDDGVSKTLNPCITVTTRIEDGNVALVFADNGPGISEENLARIREPLFTTKSFGVGLGLPAVENILEVHGGGLRIDSKLGEGTTMTAWFPVKLGTQATATAQELQVA